MSTAVTDFVGRVRLGEPAHDGGLTIIPVFGDASCAPHFITLEEAIAAGTLVVTEISEGGAVPSLRAVNRGRLGVLILDGEELVGAKQNRVLSTTVYIRPGQEIVIPVSCTEAGRWSYRSRNFGDSGHVASPGIRMTANRSVTESVRGRGLYMSDQGKVWDEVAQLQARHGHHSPTSAARDVYERKAEDMRRREAAFTCLPGQTGILVLWSGKVAGFDAVASDKVFARLHGRLVRSYALDAPNGGRPSSGNDLHVAREWLSALERVQTTEHESPGAGISYRLTGPGVVGAALAVDGCVLHAVAFAIPAAAHPDDENTHYPGFFERRGHFPW